MSRYTTSAPTRERAENDKPKAPTHCDVLGCATRWNPKTERHECGFADVVVDANGKLIARCADHYLRDIYHAGHGRWSDLARTDRISANDLAAYVPNPCWADLGAKPERERQAGPVQAGAAAREALGESV